jgi:hypothetical protein
MAIKIGLSAESELSKATYNAARCRLATRIRKAYFRSESAFKLGMFLYWAAHHRWLLRTWKSFNKTHREAP